MPKSYAFQFENEFNNAKKDLLDGYIRIIVESGSKKIVKDYYAAYGTPDDIELIIEDIEFETKDSFDIFLFYKWYYTSFTSKNSSSIFNNDEENGISLNKMNEKSDLDGNYYSYAVFWRTNFSKPGSLDIKGSIQAGLINKNIKLNITVSGEKEKEDLENNNSNIETYWQKKPEDITLAYDRMVYLQSCAYNNQWDKIKELTAEKRKSWLTSINMQQDDNVKEKYKEGIEYLRELVEYDNLSAEEKIEKEEDLKQAENIAQESAKDRFEEVEKKINILSYVIKGSEERLPNVEFIDVLTNINNYIPIGTNDGIEKLEQKASVILTVITNIGIIVAVLMSAILGVKYMLGSLEEKAEYKKDMLPYLVGALLLFGISTVVKILQGIGNSINNF